LITQYELSEYDAVQLTEEKEIVDYFELAVTKFNKPKEIANWILNDILSYLNTKNLKISDFPVSLDDMVELWSLIDNNTINKKIAREKVFQAMLETKQKPITIVEKEGLAGKNDAGEIRKWVEEVIAKNPKAVEDIKAGKEKARGSIVGQVMKASKGLANPQIVNDLIDQILK
jgi:aspartyl-tRNA(Asn)/glutamyl-tRNA(Gln) amidotransferase subunit B